MLRNKVAFVTGSTSGIGLGIARALAKEGAHVLLNGFGDAALIESLKQEISGQHGVKVLHHAADMRAPEQIADAVGYAEKELGSLDILINNAGIQHTAPVEEFARENWDAIIAINLSSAFFTSHYALPGMKKRNWGRIINVASVHGLVASANKVAYVAAKHGIVGMTKVIALETARTGITANAICPGWVLTPLVQKQIDALAAQKKISIEAATDELLAEKQPSRTFVTPEQIGALALYFCSEAASQVTGTSIPIDGGWTSQ